MSDLISREEVQVEIDKLKEIHFDRKVVLNKVSDRVNAIPSADIIEHARAIKEYCRDRDNLDEPCEDCPFHFYMGYKGHCRFKSFPSEWDLPEGEKGGVE